MEKWEYWKDESVIKRFWSKVQVSSQNECWYWRGGVFATGYGQFTINRGGKRKTLRAHRVAWSIDNEVAIPKGLVCAHSCDQPLCVNPNHLRITSQAKNVREAVERGRIVRRNGPRRKLSEAQVAEIKALYGELTQQELADRYGVSIYAISCIIRGKTWKHVLGGSTSSEEARLRRKRARKLTAEDVRMIRALYAQGMTQRELAERFGVGQTTISAVVRGASWAHLEGVNIAPAHSSAGA